MDEKWARVSYSDPVLIQASKRFITVVPKREIPARWSSSEHVCLDLPVVKERVAAGTKRKVGLCLVSGF